MPTDTGDETQPAMCYPRADQYEQWKVWADEMDMSVSEFMQAMVEAGYKQFDLDIEPDTTNTELRRQRDDLKQQLREARQRIENLEDELHRTEQETIARYIVDNPGADFEEIVQHIIDTVPRRVNQHLEAMEGDRIRARQSGYYPANDDQAD